MKTLTLASIPRLPLAIALSMTFPFVAPVAATTVAPRGSPQTHIVQNCNDGGTGSLREAYASAVDGDTVDLTGLTCSTITLTSGPIISAPNAGYVTLQGRYDSRVTLDANHTGRAIVHHGSRVAVNSLNVRAGVAHDGDGGGCIFSSADVSLLKVTLSDCRVSTTGSTPALGGGVRALSRVLLRRSVITGNSVHAAAADSAGGGIHAAMLLTAFQNTISNNSASGDGSHFSRGGGAFVRDYLRSDSDTFSGNHAETGGGVWVGTVTGFVKPNFTNTTISGNQADGPAGGVYASSGVIFDNCTITNNLAGFDFGAGVYNAAGTIDMHSTIAANNTSQQGLRASDVAGPLSSTFTGAHNIVIASTVTVPADTINADPRLSPLADHGGGVATHALLPGSPAIDAGENRPSLPYDQRAFVCSTPHNCHPAERTIGPATDIGAFEFGAPDHLFENGFEPETATTRTWLAALSGGDRSLGRTLHLRPANRAADFKSERSGMKIHLSRFQMRVHSRGTRDLDGEPIATREMS